MTDLFQDRLAPSFEFGYGLFKREKRYVWTPDEEMNPHLILCGTSGSGKSFMLRLIIDFLRRANKHVHVIDLHGDLSIPGENAMQFGGNQRSYGINPFEFDTNINMGPGAQIPVIKGMFKATYMKNMGGMQEPIIERLVDDTYREKGLYKDRPETWMVDDVKERTPSLEDMLALVNEIIDHVTSGFGEFKDVLTARGKELSKLAAILDDPGKEKKHDEAREKIALIKSDLLEICEGYIDHLYLQADSPKHGVDEKELLSHRVDLKFYSQKSVVRTLQSIAVYIESLMQHEAFNPNPPPVQPGINRWNLQYMDDSIRPFFVETLVSKVFRAVRARGEYRNLPDKHKENRGKGVDTVIVVDEYQTMLPTRTQDRENPNHPINKVALEARKYGLGIVVVTQSPAVIPQKMFTAVNKKVVLRLEANDMPAAKRFLGVDQAMLRHIQRPYTAIISNGSGGGFDPVDIKRGDCSIEEAV